MYGQPAMPWSVCGHWSYVLTIQDVFHLTTLMGTSNHWTMCVCTIYPLYSTPDHPHILIQAGYIALETVIIEYICRQAHACLIDYIFTL